MRTLVSIGPQFNILPSGSQFVKFKGRAKHLKPYSQDALAFSRCVEP
jgi:hypothetical protein